MFTSQTDIFAKRAIFDNTPTKIWFGLRILVHWNFLKNLISKNWDSFLGGESPAHDFFSSVTNGRNANHKLTTLQYKLQVCLLILLTDWAINKVFQSNQQENLNPFSLKVISNHGPTRNGL